VGLLDKIKPHKPPVRPADLSIDGVGGLTVAWADGVFSHFPPRWLRARCPCAGCVEEWTGRRTVGEAQVEPTVRCQGITRVGNYAAQLNWSDAHTTGIFSWDYLLKLREEQERDAAPAPGGAPKG
jgi:DUF971 family protein